MSLCSLALTPPRHAFSPRDSARAGDLWRLLQDAAVQGSASMGWTPARYDAEGCAFVVRAMTVRHLDTVRFGDALTGQTWVSTFRRGVVSHREIRLSGPRGPALASTQEWVHVRVGPTGVRLARASDDLVAAFGPPRPSAHVELPGLASVAEAPEHRFELTCWHTWVDPLGHVNHPAYVDWCDEATARVFAAAGGDPVALQPVAEHAVFKAGVVAGDAIVVRSRLVGRSDDAVAIEHRIEGVDGRQFVTATTIRRLEGCEVGDLVAALGG